MSLLRRLLGKKVVDKLNFKSFAVLQDYSGDEGFKEICETVFIFTIIPLVFRLDYQPLFGKMSPHSSPGEDQRPDPGDGGNRAYLVLSWYQAPWLGNGANTTKHKKSTRKAKRYGGLYRGNRK